MKKIIDGNTACSLVSYKFTEVAAIYPITPASTMAENIEKLSSSEVNFFNDKVRVIEMQSEAGAIAAVHGLLQNGILSSTYTASQGLLLMLPNMYKIAGELLPCVVNVAARTVATHALSIMGDHSDIYSARGTGFAMLSSSSVQQVMDLSNVAYLSTIKGKIPFLNFFDGFRTSHEYNKIDIIDFEKVKKLIDQKSLLEFREKSLNIDNPSTRGTNQGDAIYFQAVESRNKFYNNLPDIVNSYMESINKITGKDYKPFNYYGHKAATRVIVAMGSVCETIKEYIDYSSDKIGLIEVHLYRPFSEKYFLKALPNATKTLAVLDRTKEPGSLKEPLCLDVTNIVKNNDLNIEVIGGRYGLSSKNTNLNDIEALYEYMENPSNKAFTLGINDDVTYLSLEKTNTKFEKDYDEMLIYGYGSDGMVTTSKDILTIVGENTSKYVQGYFEYDSKKSGGVTKSHLRFGNNKIRSTYYVDSPKVVVCSKDSYLDKFDMLKDIKKNGIFLLNTENDQIKLPSNYIEIIKDRNIKFYTINASKIAIDNNIPNKISMIMEMAIFYVSDLIEKDKAKEYIKEMIIKNFSKKGEDIVNSNINALEDALKYLNREYELKEDLKSIKILDDIVSYLQHDKGNSVPVSMFNDKENGTVFPKVKKLETRNISNIVPSYNKDKCIMCNLCSFVCPHAVIRPYLLTEEEYDFAPSFIKESVKDAKIKDNKLFFTIAVSVRDCTGCSLCTNICPTKAIEMKKQVLEEQKKFDYLEKIKEKEILPKENVKNIGFVKPTFEFSGACAGCGETPYLRLLSQLFKDNLIIANATGCSSIYGASLPCIPWKNPWVNSLFEDNAEFGLGIRLAEDFGKEKVKRLMKENLDKVSNHNRLLFKEYLNNYSKEVAEKVYNNIRYNEVEELESLKKYIKEKSIWLVGGDGWAYDIGFGGIDHVISLDENINILVLDTEVYSNTGGQSSKSTRQGAIAKFNSNGKKEAKKNLIDIALAHKNAYVGTISLGANYNHTIKTLVESEKYNGPSIIIAYAPCIAHGIKKGMNNSINEEKLVVESGYFPLFTYNPETKRASINSNVNFDKIEDVFKNENRYRSSEELLKCTKENIISTYNELKEKVDLINKKNME